MDLGRLSASAANRQPLKYILSCDPATNEKIFPCIGWAAYLKDWKGPEKGERPAAYIIMLGDTTISTEFWCDHGISGRYSSGRHGKRVGRVLYRGHQQRPASKRKLAIAPEYQIMLIIALGEPAEQVRIESTVDTSGNIRYWRDDRRPPCAQTAPKRSDSGQLSEIVWIWHSNAAGKGDGGRGTGAGCRLC
ncbi:MAG: nitroreductase [Desulfobacterales bacterium]